MHVMNESILPASYPYNFDTAARAALRLLHERLGFDLWMVTRVEGNDWIVLQTEDHGYGVEANTVFRWADSFCSQMVAGRGPRIAPGSASVPAYAAAPIGRQLKIESYVGVPLTYGDGSLFGTLCAIHPTPQPEAIKEELPLIEFFAAMLSSMLNTELKATEAAREQTEAGTDAMTGLYNRRGWNRLLEAEDARCRRHDRTACIVAIDLDDLQAVNDSQGHAAGDKLICRAGRAIRGATRESDVVAWLGGDQFAVLGVESGPANSEQLLQQIREALDRAHVTASLALAMRLPVEGLYHAWQAADCTIAAQKSQLRFRASVAASREAVRLEGTAFTAAVCQQVCHCQGFALRANDDIENCIGSAR